MLLTASLLRMLVCNMSMSAKCWPVQRRACILFLLSFVCVGMCVQRACFPTALHVSNQHKRLSASSVQICIATQAYMSALAYMARPWDCPLHCKTTCSPAAVHCNCHASHPCRHKGPCMSLPSLVMLSCAVRPIPVSTCASAGQCSLMTAIIIVAIVTAVPLTC